MSHTLIHWRLGELMARHRIKGADLAEFLGVSNNAVSNLKQARTMPRITGETLNQLLTGLNQLADPLTKEALITLADLMDWVPDEPETLDRPSQPE